MAEVIYYNQCYGCKYNTVEDITTAEEFNDSTTITIDANGKFNGSDYLYLFITFRYASGRQYPCHYIDDASLATSELPDFITAVLCGGYSDGMESLSGCPCSEKYNSNIWDGGVHWTLIARYSYHYTDLTGASGDTTATITASYIVYRLNFAPNTTSNERSGIIHMTSKGYKYTLYDVVTKESLYYASGGCTTTTVANEFRIPIIQETAVISNADSADSSATYYRTSSKTDLWGVSISEFTAILGTASCIDNYSYLASESDTKHTFDYIYFCSTDNDVINSLSYTTGEFTSIIPLGRSTHVEDSVTYYVKEYKVIVTLNGLDTSRTDIVTFRSYLLTLLNLNIIQASSKGDDTSSKTDSYWTSGKTVYLIDSNMGETIDNTALLFKNNNDNVYKTIEQKDNTLFLGNYISTNNNINIYNTLQKYINTLNIETSESYIDVPLLYSTSNEDYPYLPDMTQSSLTKRLFKANETYALGLVFVDKTGTWSSVLYLGDTKGKWTPITEPSLSSDGTSFLKPIYSCTLSQELVAELYSLGIIGVIPVYAMKLSNSIKCLGYMTPTVCYNYRLTAEGISNLYSWFLRGFNKTLLDYLNQSELTAANNKRTTVEILNLDPSGTSVESLWNISNTVYTINSPEVEVDETLTESMLANSGCRTINIYNDFTYINNVMVTFAGKYTHSKLNTSDIYKGCNKGTVALQTLKDNRFITGTLWYGFLDNAYKTIAVDNGTSALLGYSGDTAYYKYFFVYPWQRDILGGEGPTYTITNKRLLNYLYNTGTNVSDTALNLDSLEDIAIYRNYDSALISRIGGTLYLGNVDYIITTTGNNAYKAYTSEGTYPTANSELTPYAGYNESGNIQDPISMKYKASPHLVVKFSKSKKTDAVTDNSLVVVEIYDKSENAEENALDTSANALSGYQWLKCGQLKRLDSSESTTVTFEEGDYFYGRFDSLRTYYYTELDVNSVVEVVSGMLCSRINLDARYDRNRGAQTPTLSPTNFNRFNLVYNLLNNYFTFSYIDLSDAVYQRKFTNSILWSLTKSYNSEVDNWCNILESNVLDLDGDKGDLQSIVKLGNNLIAFLDTGISQIQYNEKTQVATNDGTPIEIANSGKVNGKYYLYDNIGCLLLKTITKSPNGVYFIDNINNSIYLLKPDGKIDDLCTLKGMKSWAIANLDGTWSSYYDNGTLEILFTNSIESLVYSDLYLRFQAFLGYGGIRWNFRMNDYTIQICPPMLTLVISTDTVSPRSNTRSIINSVVNAHSGNTFWKKNSIDETKFFGNYSPIEIELICNPNPYLDKTFSTVEYRTDCFNSDKEYLPFLTFDTFRAWNEYLDTLNNTVVFNKSNSNEDISFNRRTSVLVKKKFRNWRIDMPRSYSGLKYEYLADFESTTDITQESGGEVDIPEGAFKATRDRIRNPWCLIKLAKDTTDITNLVFHDLIIYYF